MDITTRYNNKTLVDDASIEIEGLSFTDRTFKFSIQSERGSLSSDADWIFDWDLGDESTYASDKPMHTFCKPGTYDISVQATFVRPEEKDIEMEEGFYDPVDDITIQLAYALEVE